MAQFFWLFVLMVGGVGYIFWAIKIGITPLRSAVIVGVVASAMNFFFDLGF